IVDVNMLFCFYDVFEPAFYTPKRSYCILNGSIIYTKLLCNSDSYHAVFNIVHTSDMQLYAFHIPVAVAQVEPVASILQYNIFGVSLRRRVLGSVGVFMVGMECSSFL